MFWNETVIEVMAAHLGNVTKNTELYTFGSVNFMICELYLAF